MIGKQLDHASVPLDSRNVDHRLESQVPVVVLAVKVGPVGGQKLDDVCTSASDCSLQCRRLIVRGPGVRVDSAGEQELGGVRVGGKSTAEGGGQPLQD